MSEVTIGRDTILTTGDEFRVSDARSTRRVRYIGIRDDRGRLAVRNCLTGRLSYLNPRDPRIVLVALGADR